MHFEVYWHTPQFAARGLRGALALREIGGPLENKRNVCVSCGQTRWMLGFNT